VDEDRVRRFLRIKYLNDIFKDTWVNWGLDKTLTASGIARNLKIRDPEIEIEEAFQRAEEWLEYYQEVQNQALQVDDPPINMAKYFKEFCEARSNSYGVYRKVGISGMR
jgi:hypothetical protein